MQTAHLTSRALFRVSGPEAETFLQNLITCDVTSLAPLQATFGALLTPQGKILFDFVLQRADDGFVIDCSASMRDDLMKRLTFYRLRANVDLAMDARDVLATWGDDGGSPGDGFVDPRLAALGMRHYGKATSKWGEEACWHVHRIAKGVPELEQDYLPSSTFPHEAMMDQFTGAGVDFSKGCFVGQEVVSRMQHRGTARSRFMHVTSQTSNALPPLGTPVTSAERALGAMGSQVGANGLALVRTDRVIAAQDAKQDIVAGDVAISLSMPAYFSTSGTQ